MEFEEWQAVARAKLDLWAWINDLYPKWFMAKVVAFHQLATQTELHTQDAAISLSKRKK